MLPSRLYLNASYRKAPSNPPRTGPTTYIHRFPSGVRLNTAEARVGPHVLAGLRDAPETGPNIQMIAARANPMVTPARLGSAALSVAPNMVKTRMAVPITSARRTAPILNPRLGSISKEGLLRGLNESSIIAGCPQSKLEEPQCCASRRKSWGNGFSLDSSYIALVFKRLASDPDRTDTDS